MVRQAACVKYQGLGHGFVLISKEERRIQRNTFPNLIDEPTTRQEKKEQQNNIFHNRKKINYIEMLGIFCFLFYHTPI